MTTHHTHHHRGLRIAGWVALALLTLGSAPPGGAGGDMTHRMMVLVIQLGVIILAARTGNVLAERVKVTGVIGELLAGILIGPFVLGRIPLPSFPHGLFHVPPEYAVGVIPITPELYGICTIASIILLFLVGLETDIKLFMRYSVAGSLVGIGGVVVSFLFGSGVAVLFSDLLMGRQLGFLDAPSLFLGIICTATSVGIPARILSERNQLDSPEGVTILAGAVIDDILGIILLAVGLGILSATGDAGNIDWGQIGAIALSAILVWLAATLVGLLAAHRIGRMLKALQDPTVIAVNALALSLILAGAFEQAGLAMIIGAYVMGLSLSRTDLNQLIRERLHTSYMFLVPVFFTVMGMLVDIRMLASPAVLKFGAIYTLAAIASKILGCGLPALFANFNLRGGLRIGAGMLPRGEVALIIAGAGLASGFLSPEVFGAVILMTLATTLLAPSLLILLYRNPASGLRHPAPQGETEPVVYSFPSAETARLLVYKLMRVFEQDGFFVHTLSRSARLYQLRREGVIIGCRQKDTDILFTCGHSVIPFIDAAMIEVVADFERTLQELRKPMDLSAITTRMQHHEAAAIGTPSGLRTTSTLHLLLSPARMLPHLASTTKEEVIDELLGHLNTLGRLRDPEAARRDILEREQSLTTGLGQGIALPHARTNAVDGIECVVGLKPDGIDFAAMDGKPSRIFVLILSPRHRTAPHMQFLSRISQALNDQGRAALLACDTPEEMYGALTGETGGEGGHFPWKRSLLGALHLDKAVKPTLPDFLDRDLLTLHLVGSTKEEVIDELLALVAHAGQVSDVEAARDALFEREKQMTTGMENGIALPHAKTHLVDRLVCAVGVKKDGLDYGSLDGQPTRIVILLFTPESALSDHVHFMSLISKALDAEGRERVLAAESKDDLWHALTESE